MAKFQVGDVVECVMVGFKNVELDSKYVVVGIGGRTYQDKEDPWFIWIINDAGIECRYFDFMFEVVSS